jgi:hypothetical protein
MRSEMEKLKALERIVELDKAAGRRSDQSDVTAIEETRERIESLISILAERNHQQGVAEEAQTKRGDG